MPLTWGARIPADGLIRTSLLQSSVSAREGGQIASPPRAFLKKRTGTTAASIGQVRCRLAFPPELPVLPAIASLISSACRHAHG